MPRCKNDPAKSYTGKEPSPKGLGLCAHAAPVGAVSKGKDGKRWQVNVDKNGVKSWKPYKAPVRLPMTVPRALEILGVDPASGDDMSVLKLKVRQLNAAKAFRAAHPETNAIGLYKDQGWHIGDAYRFLVQRLCDRKLAPASWGEYLNGRAREPAAYARVVAQAKRLARS